MNNHLDRLEAKLRTIFEDNLTRLIHGSHSSEGLFDRLRQEMHNQVQEKSDGQIYAPDRYTIHVPSEDLTDWDAYQDVLDEMAQFLQELGLSEGYSFNKQPNIMVKPKKDSSNHDFFITTDISSPPKNLPDTSAMTNRENARSEIEIPQHAFLIVGGKDNFPLEKSIINIGRHSDNDLILDEPHVSRHHAQLRALNRRYVIFDVGSTGGLLINGKPISQATLQPGDVIRIGLINLIFVQDITSETPTMAMSIDENQSDPESSTK